MNDKMKQWLLVFGQLAPVVLMTIPGGAAFAPLATVAMHAMVEMQLTSKPGPERKTHVLAAVDDSVVLANAIAVKAGKPAPFDPAQMQATASVAIDTVIETVKVVQNAHDALAPQSAGPGGVTNAA